jgi:2-oxoglutarate ferredoxin oxidoreductase subunit alpha
MKTRDDLSIVFAGEAGQGIQSIESLITLIAKRASFHVFATKEYMSRIRGGCNSTELRFSGRRLAARVGRIDLLVPLSSASIGHLSSRLDATTVIIGDKSVVGHEGMIDLPFSAVAAELGGKIYANSVAAGSVAAIIGLSLGDCEAVVDRFFAKRDAVVLDANREAFRRGHALGAALGLGLASGLGHDPAAAGDLMVSGAEAIAFGALAGGCDFVAAYPMSPGTSVLTALAGHSRRFDLIVEQVEDEIGAANMAIGAWYAGSRALVTTSGGGFALMSEAVSLAGAIETPLVVHIAQRPGPATGLPTRTEQGDLNLAIHAGHGDFLKIVLAPGDLEEGFELGKRAFELADRWQSPVFILSDQYYVDSYYTTPPFEVPDEAPHNLVVSTEGSYRRFALGAPDGISPRGLPGLGSGIVCVDSDEHDEGGYITEDADMRRAMVDKRLAKLAEARREAPLPVLHGTPSARVVIVGWGSVKGPVLEALASLGRDEVAYLHFSWVFPLPEGLVDLLRPGTTLVAVEGNATGQFADLVEAATGRHFGHRILAYNGAQFTVEDLVGRLEAILDTKEAAI